MMKPFSRDNSRLVILVKRRNVILGKCNCNGHASSPGVGDGRGWDSAVESPSEVLNELTLNEWHLRLS